MSTTAAALEAVNVLLAGTRLLRELGVNYRQIVEAQARADAEGRPLSQAEIQPFLDEAQAAINQL